MIELALHKKDEATMHENMFCQLGLQKVIIRHCREVFRKIVTRHGLSLISQIQMCRNIDSPYQGDYIAFVQGESEVYVTYIKCSIEVEVFKIRTSFN